MKSHRLDRCFSDRCSRQSTGSFRRKSIAEIVSDTEQIKKMHTICLLKLLLLVELQQEAGELVLSMTACLSVIILENFLNLFIGRMWSW
jgi:hypothetical protein